MYYCALDGGFYDMEFHGAIPDGSVNITDKAYAALLRGQEQGKRIVCDDNGFPELVDSRPVSAEMLAAIERQWRDERLLTSDSIVSRHRDELENGTDTTLALEQYGELQVYRRHLRDWPQSLDFPKTDHRPITPPWLDEPKR